MMTDINKKDAEDISRARFRKPSRFILQTV